MTELLEGELTAIIIRVFYRVYDRLGFGFLESVYCEALAIEFELEGLCSFERQRSTSTTTGAESAISRLIFS